MYIRFSKASKRSCEFVIPGEYELINVRGYINRPVDCIKEDIAGMFVIIQNEPSHEKKKKTIWVSNQA